MSATPVIKITTSKIRELFVHIEAYELKDRNGYNIVNVEEFDTVRFILHLPGNNGRTRTRQFVVDANDFRPERNDWPGLTKANPLLD